MGLNLNDLDKKKLFDEFIDYIENKYEGGIKDTIPLSIFNEKLTAFESIVKYLSEEKDLPNSEISVITCRSRQVVWTTLKRAKEKLPEKLELNDCDFTIPYSKFKSENLSISVIIAIYLKEKRDLRLNEIAEIMERDARTIWTLIDRAEKKKHGKK